MKVYLVPWSSSIILYLIIFELAFFPHLLLTLALIITRQTTGLHYEPNPPTSGKVRWSIGPRSNDWKDITIEVSSDENCKAKNTAKTVTEKDRGNQKSETY